MKYSFYTTLVFFLLAAPETYKTIQHVLAPFTGTLSVNGCPNTLGLGVQTGLFFVVMLALLSIPRE
jgi:hypothetical protein